MNTIRLSVKLFTMQILMTLILLFVSMLFYSIYPGNKLYHWIIGVAYILVYWYVIYKYTSILGKDDAMKGRFAFFNGFSAGFIATLPVLIFFIFTELLSLPFTYVRLWLFPYDMVLQTFGNTRHYLAVVVALIFPVATGISYPFGIIKWNKIKMKFDTTKAKR